MSGSLRLFAAICLCLVPYCARAAGEPITVFAAAITDVLQKIDHGYPQETGTPAQWMDYLVRKGLIAAQGPLHSNELAAR